MKFCHPLYILLIFIANIFIINDYTKLMRLAKQNQSGIINTNRSLPHPSHQSQGNSYRPSIKVGYKLIKNITQEKRHKKKIQPNYVITQRINSKKMGENIPTQISGKFVNSEYIKSTQNVAHFFQKKGVSECRQKYQNGEAVKQQMSNQFVENKTSRRSSSVASVTSSRSKNQLPSYQSTGIKDIMQYHHALPYRQTPVTAKCTTNSALSRFVKFSDLHEYDFRKRPQFLR